MKRLGAFLLTALLLTGCHGDKTVPTQPTDTVNQNQNNQLKTVYIRTSETLTSGSNVTRTDYLLGENNQVSQVVIYTNDAQTQCYDVQCDENGNYVQWVSDDIRITYAYDQMGRPLGSTCYHGETVTSSVKQIWGGENLAELVVRNGSQETRTVYTYNDAGLKIREELYLEGVLCGYSQLVHDDQGAVLTQTIYNANGTEDKSIHYVHEGNTSTATTVKPDGTVERKTVEVYDDHGNLTRTTEYDGQDRLLTEKTATWTPIQVPITIPRASV